MASTITVSLREILVPHGDWIVIDPDVDYRQVTARLWGKGLILRGVIKGAAIAATSQNRVRCGQFLISKIDARHGAFGIVPPELDGAVVSSDFPAFEVLSDRVLPDFLRWVSATDWFVALCKRASEGSTNRVRLKQERFLNQRIPLPPFSVQRRIVARLDAAAAGIVRREAESEAMAADLAATLRAAFSRIVADAPRMRMGDIAPLVRRPVEIEPDASYPELGVRSFGRGLFAKPDLKGSDLTWQKLFGIQSGDLVFSNIKAWEGAFAVADDRHHGCVGSHRYLTSVPNTDHCSGWFIWYFLQSEAGLAQIQAASPGSADRNRTLSQKGLEAIMVPVPSLDAQRWFDSLQTRAAAIRQLQTCAKSDLDALLPSMLNEVFG